MSKLSVLAEGLIGSEIVRLGNEINDRIRKGEKIYNYTIGDFDPSIFPIPKELETLIIESYQKHYTNYPPADGILELRESVLAFLQKHEGLQYSNNEILIASGGRPLIYTTFKILVDKGDKVIYAVPSWNNNHYTNLNQAEHCVVEATPENNFMPTAADIAPHVKGAALICLCTPQNPTGTTLPKEGLDKICQLIIEENASRGENEKKLYLLFDQMYWTLTYGETKHYNPITLQPKMKDYTIFVDGISKVFAATGVRVGWSLGPAHIISKMKALLSHVGAWAPMAEQKATAAYLKQEDAIERYLNHFKNEMINRLNLIHDGFVALKNKGYAVDAIAPQAAIYLTIKMDLVGKSVNGKVLATQSDVTEYILGEAKLAVVPFYAFGAEKTSPWYRLSIGTCKLEDISEMFGKLEAALSKLN
ncbi:pyridoxal phosphate-dependent aminotransferase [Pinibacter aurantiacus]|uniref:Aminotransferase class I/II-fold pyridoxal phosphate-dependent enzyme n=1 Tax=Pinibacter aurantiacus TaxID=2851599 RepID=A0A9E2S5U5_9BACT|nr:aminotransferase class I/II-fold pyridoxal phosphate-dependent enzyme [Pinibacter aurantiacus]MBV4356321.1 aminotransferase class I/II-fold pyridoxal phosphate-dependent enzyme [Pinibacter aurantiacus]